MYLFNYSVASMFRKAVYETNLLSKQEAMIIEFMEDLGLQRYDRKEVEVIGENKIPKKGYVYLPMAKTLRGAYTQSREKSMRYGNSYAFPSVSFNVDYIVKYVGSEIRCVINVNHHDYNTRTTYASYFESATAENTISQVVDLMFSNNRFTDYQSKLRKFKIDGILKDLEQGLV